jgi:hypothetical protein
MSNTPTKAKILRAVEDLPEDATIEDAIERLVFLHKVEVGRKQVQEGKTTSLDEVESQLQKRRASTE